MQIQQRTLIVWILSILLLAAYAFASDGPKLTNEEALVQQVASLQQQLAASLRAVAKCESGGTQADALDKAASDNVKSLLQALDKRGLQVNDKGELLAKPTK